LTHRSASAGGDRALASSALLKGCSTATTYPTLTPTGCRCFPTSRAAIRQESRGESSTSYRGSVCSQGSSSCGGAPARSFRWSNRRDVQRALRPEPDRHWLGPGPKQFAGRFSQVLPTDEGHRESSYQTHTSLGCGGGRWTLSAPGSASPRRSRGRIPTARPVPPAASSTSAPSPTPSPAPGTHSRPPARHTLLLTSS